MTPSEITNALEEYSQELSSILGRFTKNHDGIHINLDDNYRVRSITTELMDLFSDHIPGSEHHLQLLANYYNEGISNFTNSSSYASVEEIRGLVETVRKRIERNPGLFADQVEKILVEFPENQLLNSLGNVLTRFHSVVVQLRDRHDGRETLDVNDEYDVQDLLHALLRLHFEDIRPEEWTPSYAGSTARTDFLLPQIDTFVEVKKTRKGLDAKTIGEQLIIDIERYQNHPQCRRLVCFVYDQEGRIANPKGLENDLVSRNRDIEVQVWIRPQSL